MTWNPPVNLNRPNLRRGDFVLVHYKSPFFGVVVETDDNSIGYRSVTVEKTHNLALQPAKKYTGKYSAGWMTKVDDSMLGKLRSIKNEMSKRQLSLLFDKKNK